VKEKFKSLIKYLSEGIWLEDIENLEKKKLRRVRLLRIIMLIGHGFSKDNCALHASSLTFISLLSFVPVLTICFIFANAMGATDKLQEETKSLIKRIAEAPLPLEKEISMLKAGAKSEEEESFVVVTCEEAVEQMSEAPNAVNTGDNQLALQQTQAEEGSAVDFSEEPVFQEESKTTQNGVITVDTINRLIDRAFEKINSINFKALGIVGFIFFAWTVFGLLEKVESAFNAVWKQKKSRPTFIKLRDYSVILFVVPALCVLAFLIPLLNFLINNISKLDGGLIAALVDNAFTRFIVVTVLLILAFAIIQKAIPYAKVSFRAAWYGGLVTAIGFVVWLKLCLSLQIGVAKYSAAFGSFAIVPILLFWIYISWQIMLLGAEVSHALQNWRINKLPSDDNK
jgi:membrane protein